MPKRKGASKRSRNGQIGTATGDVLFEGGKAMKGLYDNLTPENKELVNKSIKYGGLGALGAALLGTGIYYARNVSKYGWKSGSSRTGKTLLNLGKMGAKKAYTGAAHVADTVSGTVVKGVNALKVANKLSEFDSSKDARKQILIGDFMAAGDNQAVATSKAESQLAKERLAIQQSKPLQEDFVYKKMMSWIGDEPVTVVPQSSVLLNN